MKFVFSQRTVTVTIRTYYIRQERPRKSVTLFPRRWGFADYDGPGAAQGAETAVRRSVSGKLPLHLGRRVVISPCQAAPPGAPRIKAAAKVQSDLEAAAGLEESATVQKHSGRRGSSSDAGAHGAAQAASSRQARGHAKGDGKAASKGDGKAGAKAGAKADGKTGAKAGAKTDEKASGKTVGKAGGKAGVESPPRKAAGRAGERAPSRRP